MKYSFDKDFATRYDVEQAVIIDNLIYWQAKNQANGHNFVEGKFWTYNKREAFLELFPFFKNIHKIKRLLGKLEENGIIEIANHNKDKRDQTLWYTVVDSWTLQLYNFQCAEMHNEACKNAQSQCAEMHNDNKETDSKQQSVKPNNKHTLPSQGECVSHDQAIDILENWEKDSFNADDLIKVFGIKKMVAKSWIKVRKERKATNTPFAFKKFVCQSKKAGHSSIEETILFCMDGRSWAGFEAAWVGNDGTKSNNTNSDGISKVHTSHNLPAYSQEELAKAMEEADAITF